MQLLESEPSIKAIDKNTFIIPGLLSINEFNDYFNEHIESENYDTMSGFIIETIGRIPEGTDEKNIEYKNLIFKIEEVKEKRIEKIKLYIQSKE